MTTQPPPPPPQKKEVVVTKKYTFFKDICFNISILFTQKKISILFSLL